MWIASTDVTNGNNRHVDCGITIGWKWKEKSWWRQWKSVQDVYSVVVWKKCQPVSCCRNICQWRKRWQMDGLMKKDDYLRELFACLVLYDGLRVSWQTEREKRESYFSKSEKKQTTTKHHWHNWSSSNLRGKRRKEVSSPSQDVGYIYSPVNSLVKLCCWLTLTKRLTNAAVYYSVSSLLFSGWTSLSVSDSVTLHLRRNSSLTFKNIFTFSSFRRPSKTQLKGDISHFLPIHSSCQYHNTTITSWKLLDFTIVWLGW